MRSLISMILCVIAIQANSETLEPFAEYRTPVVRRSTAKNSNSKCTISDGICVKIFDCDKLYHKYVQGGQEERESLRSVYCGWEQGAPKVCCATTDSQRRRRRAQTPTGDGSPKDCPYQGRVYRAGQKIFDSSFGECNGCRCGFDGRIRCRGTLCVVDEKTYQLSHVRAEKRMAKGYGEKIVDLYKN